MKKLLIILMLLIAPVILYLACNPCGCPPVTEKYYKINSINVTPFGNGNVPVDRGIPVSVDTINFSYIFLTSCVAATQKNPMSAFMSAAYACSCASCGDYGLKSKIKSITISSDSTYSSSLPPNTSLNALFAVKKRNYYSGFEKITIDSAVKEINKEYTSLRDNLLLFITKKPSASFTHKFKLVIEFENADKFEIITAPITWF